MKIPHLNDREDIALRRLKNYKVLIGVPTYEGKNYCANEFYDRITNLTYNNYDICVVDNSPTFKNKQALTEKGLFCIHVEPRKRPNHQVIAHSLEVLRDRALKKGYDFLMIIESDIIPPHNVIERLLLHQKMITSASYFVGQGSDRHLMIQELEPLPSPRNIANINRGKDILLADGKLHKVYSCGIGCILIHKSVFKEPYEIKFRWPHGANAHPDSFFSADLYIKRMDQYLDTSILCEHRNESWSSAKATEYKK